MSYLFENIDYSNFGNYFTCKVSVLSQCFCIFDISTIRMKLESGKWK